MESVYGGILGLPLQILNAIYMSLTERCGFQRTFNGIGIIDLQYPRPPRTSLFELFVGHAQGFENFPGTEKFFWRHVEILKI